MSCAPWKACKLSEGSRATTVDGGQVSELCWRGTTKCPEGGEIRDEAQKERRKELC